MGVGAALFYMEGGAVLSEKVAFEQRPQEGGAEDFGPEKWQQSTPKEEHGAQGVGMREAVGWLVQQRTLGFTSRNEPSHMCQELCHMVTRNRAASVLMELVSKRGREILINQRKKGHLRKAPLIKSLFNWGPSASLAQEKCGKFWCIPSLHVDPKTSCFALSA